MAQNESEQVLKQLPENFQAMLIYGKSSMYRKNINEAEKAFNSLIKMAPNNPTGYYYLGLLQRLQKKYDLALANFDKAMSIKPKLMDVFTNIVLVYMAKDEFETAIKKCDSQLAKVQDTPALMAMIYNLKGELYLTKKKLNQAEESFKKALEENPNFLRPYFALGRIYYKEKKEDKAIAQYKAALEKNPDQPKPHMLLGIIYDGKKQYDLSEKQYRAAMDIDPEFAPAANNLAYLLIEQNKDIEEALKFAQIAKKKLPKDPDVMDTLGLAYYKKGFYDNAIAEFLDSLELRPDHPMVHYHLGLAYFKKGDKDQARKELEKALKLDQKFDGADNARQILSKL